MSLIKEDTEKSNYLNNITQGVVLTGGCALLPGIADLASKVFGKSVRIGRPNYQGELNDLINEPRFSTVMGLLDYSLEQISSGMSKRSSKKKGSSLIHRAFSWLRDFF